MRTTTCVFKTGELFFQNITYVKTDFQIISAYDITFKKRKTLFKNITYPSNCNDQYGACKVHIWGKYSVFTVLVQC